MTASTAWNELRPSRSHEAGFTGVVTRTHHQPVRSRPSSNGRVAVAHSPVKVEADQGALGGDDGVGARLAANSLQGSRTEASAKSGSRCFAAFNPSPTP